MTQEREWDGSWKLFKKNAAYAWSQYDCWRMWKQPSQAETAMSGLVEIINEDTHLCSISTGVQPASRSNWGKAFVGTCKTLIEARQLVAAAIDSYAGGHPRPRFVRRMHFNSYERRIADTGVTHMMYGPLWFGTGPLHVTAYKDRIVLSDGDDWYAFSPNYESKHELRKAMERLLRVQRVTKETSKARLSDEMLSLGYRDDDPPQAKQLKFQFMQMTDQ